MIAALRESQNGAELRCETTRKRNRPKPAFQTRHAFFERRDSRIADAAVDMSVAAQLEKFACFLCRVENESGGLVDRCNARTGYGVGRRARVYRAGGESVLTILH